MKSIGFIPALKIAVRRKNKTHTRRIITPSPELHEPAVPLPLTEWTKYLESFQKKGLVDLLTAGPYVGYILPKCPFGKAGDKLYIKEEFYKYGHWEKDNSKVRKSGKQAWRFVEDSTQTFYDDNSPEAFKISRDKQEPHKSFWYKRLARFMPKALARYTVTIQSVRCERLLDITEEDAKAEGVELYNNYDGTYGGHGAPMSYKESFLLLFAKIHGQDVLKTNPFVWVIEFEFDS